ncbi:MAG: DUF3040 domain-containing protein [Leucobacter sp.]
MALSEREQRLLEEMERGFYQSEADVMEAGVSRRRRTSYRSLVLGIIVVLAGIGAMIGGVAAQQLWLGLIGFAAMVGGVLLMTSGGEEADLAPVNDGRGSQDAKKEAGESLSERMERRWDERMGGSDS